MLHTLRYRQGLRINPSCATEAAVRCWRDVSRRGQTPARRTQRGLPTSRQASNVRTVGGRSGGKGEIEYLNACYTGA